MPQSSFDASRHRWRKVTGDPGSSYPIHHDYTLLGWDAAGGTLDMVVRWYADGGHCPLHRHLATTTVLVLEGEQHLWDLRPDGTRGPERVRRAGDYALSTGDALPHFERGGSEGGLVFFGTHARDGLLYEIVGEDGKPLAGVSIESLVADWKANT
jgi:predicted metal-dependent enzyme (double-stranded beta helix superfamily)